MKVVAILAAAVWISGCSMFGGGSPEIQYVKVPVPGPSVPCLIPKIDPPPDLVSHLKPEDDIFVKTRAILADKALKDTYREQLETAITACNQNK